MSRLLALMLGVVCVVAADVSAVEIAFSSNSVQAKGVSPGGQTVWFVVQNEQTGYESRVRQSAVTLPDLDRDGAVEFSAPEGYAPRSIWAVVDLGTGESAIAVPPGVRAEIGELPSDVPGRGANGKANRLIRKALYNEVLVVRPGVGAWQLTAGDGGSADEDREGNGQIRMALENLVPVTAGAAVPAEFAKGDVIVAVDPFELRAYSFRVRGNL